MNNKKKFIFSIVLLTVGIIGGGLFAIANSIERTTPNYNITCGILLFVLLGLAVAGFIIAVSETFNSKNKQ